MQTKQLKHEAMKGLIQLSKATRDNHMRVSNSNLSSNNMPPQIELSRGRSR